MTLKELCNKADYVNKDGIILNDDCISVLSNISSREREREDNFNYNRHSL